MRPSEYSPEVVTLLCERIASGEHGEGLRDICAADDMPAASTVYKWLADPAHADFVEQYARARVAQAHRMAEETVAIADEECTMVRADKHGAKADDPESGEVEVVFDATAVARNRLRVDARKWLSSKLAPKVYGDRVTTEHTGPNGGPVQVADVSSEALDARIAALKAELGL